MKKNSCFIHALAFLFALQFNILAPSYQQKILSTFYAFNSWSKKNKYAIMGSLASLWYLTNVYACKDNNFWQTKTFIEPLSQASVRPWLNPSRLEFKNIMRAFFGIIDSEFNRLLINTFFNPSSFRKKENTLKNKSDQLQKDIQEFETLKKINIEDLKKESNLMTSWQLSVDLLTDIGVDKVVVKYNDLKKMILNCKTNEKLEEFLKDTGIKAEKNNDFELFKNNVKKGLMNISTNAGAISNAWCNLQHAGHTCEEDDKE